MSGEPHSHRCPACGHESTFVITQATIDVSVLVFCTACGVAMDRLDALGAIEAEQSSVYETFEEFLARPGVVGIVRAEVPATEEDS